MDQKMTYKQALIRSLMVGLVFTVVMFLSLLLRSNLPYWLEEFLVFKINGFWLWFYFLFFVLGYTYFGGIVILVSPMIVSLSLGCVVFLLLRNKKWLTQWNFTFILLATYLVVNVGASMLVDSCLS